MGVQSVRAQQDCVISWSTDWPDSFILALSLPQAMPLQKWEQSGSTQAGHCM